MTHERALTRPALWIACMLSWACSAHKMPHPASSLTDIGFKPQSQAGVSAVDITPPAGLGMFGHGPEARIAEGTLLRLRCHAFVFVGAAADGEASPEALALVPCELAAPSLLLQREVAKKVRARDVPLGADRIWISATHTHAAPAHYFASDSFSGPTSGRRIGFDARVLDFLAERVARAVVEAYLTRKPARWAWVASDVFGLGRNRAYPSLVANRVLPPALTKQLAAPHEDITQAAIDPQLALLRIDQRPAPGAPFAPTAALLVFGVHPTAIDHTNPLYGGDVFGYAERALAHALLQETGRPVLVGIANGVEGDVTPVRTDGTVEEAKRLGAALAGRAAQLWKDEFSNEAALAKLDEHAQVRSAYRDLDFSDARVWRAGKLCAVPELGTPAGGGADDHPTFLRAFEPFNPGVHAREPRTCQGPKYPIQNLGKARAGTSFPRFAPIGSAILGNGLLITLPAELTTVTGTRIRDTVAAITRGWRERAPRVTALLGLTNEYLEYVATADEYALQRYEGASTLYGPQSAEFLREQSACLVRYLGGGSGDCNGQRALVNQPIEIEYEPSFAIDWWGRLERRGANGVLALSKPISDPSTNGAPRLSTTLHGVYPGDMLDPDRFRVEILVGKRTVADSQGADIALRWNDAAREWRLAWTPDLSTGAALCGKELAFRVRVDCREVQSGTTTLRCGSKQGALP